MRPALRRLAAGAIALLALAGAADAQQASPKPKAPDFVVPPPPTLRGAQTDTPPAPAPARRPRAQQTPAQTPGSTVTGGPLSQALPPRADTTGRLGGLEAEGVGGAQCRTSCAQAYYFCLSNQGGDDTCAVTNTQCVLACPTNSSSF